jgi:catechol 2,3-dioxygenase-like lactoylglutathione lyase family enzyme
MDVGFPSWIGVVCEDFENQRAFYGEVLGLREVERGEDWAQYDMGPTSRSSYCVGPTTRNTTVGDTKWGSSSMTSEVLATSCSLGVLKPSPTSKKPRTALLHGHTSEIPRATCSRSRNGPIVATSHPTDPSVARDPHPSLRPP